MKYLASPYSVVNSHELTERQIRNRLTRRFKQVCKKAAELMLNGEIIFCPIAHSHPIEVNGMPERKTGEFWLQQDFGVLEHCEELVVYRMPGWQQSHGVAAEIAFAQRENIPISYID